MLLVILFHLLFLCSWLVSVSQFVVQRDRRFDGWPAHSPRSAPWQPRAAGLTQLQLLGLGTLRLPSLAILHVNTEFIVVPRMRRLLGASLNQFGGYMLGQLASLRCLRSCLLNLIIVVKPNRQQSRSLPQIAARRSPPYQPDCAFHRTTLYFLSYLPSSTRRSSLPLRCFLWLLKLDLRTLVLFVPHLELTHHLLYSICSAWISHFCLPSPPRHSL